MVKRRSRHMKRMLIVLLLLVLSNTAFAENPLLVSVSMSYLSPTDTGYRSIYGRHVFFPEIMLGLRISGGLFVSGNFAILSKTGRTQDLGLLAQSRQNFLSVNLGYIRRISGKFLWEAQAGVVRVDYREEAMESWVTGKTPGFRAELGLLLMKEDGNIFIGLKAGYILARVEEFDIKLGGPTIGLCFGIM